MAITFRGVAGPGMAVKIVLQLGPPVSVGRGIQTSFPIPDDTTLSGIHFSLELRDEHVLLHDLDSTNGTYVNGVRVRDHFLMEGDSILAGQSVFKMQMQPEMLDPLTVLSALSEPLYAVMDAAREPRILELLRLSGEQYLCLHYGKTAAELELVAPYLVQFAPQSALLKKIVAEGWGKAWGIFFTSLQPINLIWRQLQCSLMVTLEAEDTAVYFRYYDPRVLREILPILSPQQMEELGGPISCYFMEDEEPDGMLRFAKVGGPSKFERIAVESPMQ